MPQYSASLVDSSSEELHDRIEQITEKCSQDQLKKLNKALDELSYVVNDIEEDITEAEEKEEEDPDEDDDE